MNKQPAPADNSLAATPAWLACLHDSMTVEQVLEIVNEYVATWEGGQLDAVPAECRPVKVATADGLAHIAYRLVMEQCNTPDPEHPVNRIATVFGVASHRISQIVAEARHEAERQAFFKTMQAPVK